MKKSHLLILLGIAALGAFLRFYQITEIPPGLYPDEAMNGNNALEALSVHPFGAGLRVFYPENTGREGLFINIQALSIKLFGAVPWALRIVSAAIGTLTIIGVYLAAREIFASGRAGLFAAFFLAASYWHLNFSRIGFRAIMLPLMATFGVYFLLRAVRRGKIYDTILAGLFTGLGVYTYIAFRFMVFVFAVPVVAALARWRRSRAAQGEDTPCAPCSVALYALVAFAVLIPLGLYFARHPADFLNRAGEVSVFSASSPAQELAVSAAKTAGMLFWGGDCNWRHNLPCQPELHPLVMALLFIGLAVLIRKLATYKLQAALFPVWLAAMAMPAILTREGLPHALRAIGMIPPVMILAALGADAVVAAAGGWIDRQKVRWPVYQYQLERIRRELAMLGIAILVLIPLATYRAYFIVWAPRVDTYDAFATSDKHLGAYLASLPDDVRKYVIVNRDGIMARGIPVPSQTVMFVTDTFRQESRQEKNFVYIPASGGDPKSAADLVVLAAGERTVIAVLDGMDTPLVHILRRQFSALRAHAPGDFVILQNF